MKTEVRIINYIENELTSEEKSAFEEELKNSVGLREELRKYLSVKEETEHLKNLKLNPLYLDSILPEFRNRIDTGKSFNIRKNLGFAFGAMLIIIVSVIVMKTYFNNQTNANEIENFTQSLDENQKIELLERINGDSEVYNLLAESFSEPEMISLFESNLEVNNEVAKAYDIEYSDIVSVLSDEEIEEIYNKIINTNLLIEAAL